MFPYILQKDRELVLVVANMGMGDCLSTKYWILESPKSNFQLFEDVIMKYALRLII